MITATAVVLAVNVLTALLKKWVMPKWGREGVHATVFVLALIAAVYFNYGEAYQVYVMEALVVFSAAVALYEVILSRISFFK